MSLRYRRAIVIGTVETFPAARKVSGKFDKRAFPSLDRSYTGKLLENF